MFNYGATFSRYDFNSSSRIIHNAYSTIFPIICIQTAAVGRDHRARAYAHVPRVGHDGDAAAGFGHPSLHTAVSQDFGAARMRCVLHDLHVFDSAQHDAPALHRGSLRLDHAAVAQRAGKHTHGIALQGTQIDDFTVCALDDETHAFQSAPGDFDLLARADDDVAVIGSDQCGFVAHADLGRKQHDVAIGRTDGAVHIHAAGERIAAKAQFACLVVGIGHVQRGGGKPGGVDHPARADGDAVLVDQNNLAIGRQSAKNGGGLVGDDAVQRRAVGIRLGNIGGVALFDIEALPVNGAALAACSVGGGDVEAFAGLLKCGTA